MIDILYFRKGEGFMAYNYYDKDKNYNEITYYPSDYDEKPKKKNHFLRALAAVACVVAISAASISGYKIYSDFSEKNSSAKDEAHSSSTVSQTQDGDIGKTAENNSVSSDELKSIISVASRKDALTIPEIVEKVTPSVVGVSSTLKNGKATGSGIIMSDDGYIVTNAHVVEDAVSVSILLESQNEYDAEIIGIDSQTDIAVLKISADEKLVPAEFGDSDSLVVGETAIVVGNPLGFEFYSTVTSGIISGLNRELTIEDKTLNLIQTDAAINGGNSGGALVNSCGQVVGISSAKIVTTVAEGMGFAIPINEAVPIIDELINNGYVTGRPLIGITGFDIDERTAYYYNMKKGVYVAQIMEDSPASNAGIKVGDIIIRADGKEISTMTELNAVKNNFKPNDTLTVKVFRNGAEKELTLILGEITQ